MLLGPFLVHIDEVHGKGIDELVAYHDGHLGPAGGLAHVGAPADLPARVERRLKDIALGSAESVSDLHDGVRDAASQVGAVAVAPVDHRSREMPLPSTQLDHTRGQAAARACGP